MENLSATLRHCHTSFSLRKPNRRYLINSLKYNHSSTCFSLDIKHALSSESIPTSVSLALSSSSSELYPHPLTELKNCDDLASVKATHARFIRMFDRFDLECLISRYLEFGELGYACAIFFMGFPRNQVSWMGFLGEVESFG